MTDAKGATAPGFQHLINLDKRLIEDVNADLVHALDLIMSCPDGAASSRRWAEISRHINSAQQLAVQGWACASMRESADG